MRWVGQVREREVRWVWLGKRMWREGEGLLMGGCEKRENVGV